MSEEKKEQIETLEQKFELASKLLYKESRSQQDADNYLKKIREIKRELNNILRKLGITVESAQQEIIFSQGFKEGCMALWSGMITASVNGNNMVEFECARELYDTISPYYDDVK